MRRFSLLLTPEEGALHPVNRACMDHPDVTREALLHTSLLSDGTAVIVARLRGDPAVADEIFADEPTALSHDVFGIDGEQYHAYIHIESAGSAIRLIEITKEYNVLILPPLEYTEKGLRVTLAGTQKRIRESATAVPEKISVQLLGSEPYDPERDDIVAQLTERQREVLTVAVEIGYYETPRRATHADIAEVIGSATGTVGEHLRKIEGEVFPELVS
jgi:predicted DNA binding protein